MCGKSYKLPPALARDKFEDKQAALAKPHQFNIFLIALAQNRAEAERMFIFFLNFGSSLFSFQANLQLKLEAIYGKHTNYLQ